jgi:polyhydroxybutyrate depolymerase
VGGTTRLLVVVLGLSAIACGGHSPTGPSDPVKAETLIVNGMTRTYYLHVPAGFQSGSGALVLALHGRTQSGSFFRAFTNLDAKADQAGFAVAYPEGLFQPGNGAVNWAFYRNDFVDDVSFLRTLISTLEGRVHFDRRRVFATGFSAGGFMAYRLAIEVPESVAAIAVVGGASVSRRRRRGGECPSGPRARVRAHAPW